MTAIERSVDRALRAADRDLGAIGREIREARLEHDLSQAAVARAAGLARSSLSRMERGVALNVPLADIARATAAVGLKLHVRLYPGGEPTRDTPQQAVLERLRVVLPLDATWNTEVVFPNPGDHRAWDALVRMAGILIGIEAETRGRDAQALQRKLALKRRDGGADRLILLMADTRHNRHFLRNAGEGFHRDFPVAGNVALERLRAGQDIGGDAIILI